MEDCTVFSFKGGEVDFSASPLEVRFEMLGQSDEEIEIPNFINVKSLEESIAKLKPIKSWTEMLDHAREIYKNLEIGDILIPSGLDVKPYKRAISRSALNLMGILNEYAGDLGENGKEGSTAQQIYKNFFHGDNAKFSDESPQNKIDFEKEMTFSSIHGDMKFAPWHGKISHDFFRLHFERSLVKNKKKIEVFYIGPKITT